MTLDQDFKSGMLIATLILNFVNSSSLTKILQLKEKPTYQEQYKDNMTKILEAFKEIGF